MTPEVLLSLGSFLVALLALVFTTLLLWRQVRQMEHERNALAMLEAIERLTDRHAVETLLRLEGINDRYDSDEAVLERFRGSQDERDVWALASFMETIAVLTRRNVLDASLLVDSIGYMLRRNWVSVSPFVERLRRVYGNPDILNNFEWLAKYSAWWKDVPRRTGEKNYAPEQFADIVVAA